MKKQPYKHLSKEDRDLIAVLRGEGRGIRSIARELGRDPSTLSRELRRNVPPIKTRYYLPHKAHERAVNRFSESHQRDRLKEPRVRRYVRERIRAGWSPELTAGRWSNLHPKLSVSYEAIYQWVYADAPELIPYLVRAHKKRKMLVHKWSHRRYGIPGRIPLSERPKEVQQRRVAGHWETDTAVSRASRATLQVSIERKTRFTKLAKMKSNTAHEMSKALARRLSQMPKRLRQTITYDNGRENIEHARTDKILKTKSYFCAPYHSWEKGSVENNVGIVRRSLPKKTDFSKVSSKKLRTLERWMNNRPRKCLNYRTPAEAWKDEGVALAG